MANTTASDLNALTKEIYGDRVIELPPKDIQLAKDLKFREAESTGRYFYQPVKLSHENGITYDNTGGAFQLNAVVPAIFEDAQVDGSAFLLKSAISYTQLAKLDTSKKGFQSGPARLMRDMNDSMWRRLEVNLFYGRAVDGLGLVDAGSSDLNGAGGTITVTIDRSQWAPGIWVASENTYVDFYHTISWTGGTITGTKRNAGRVFVQSVDAKNRVVVFDTSAGDTGTTFVAGDAIYFEGAFGVEAIGIAGTVDASDAGDTYWNIDSGTYSLWEANSFDVAGNLSLSKVYDVVEQATQKGFKGDCCMYIPTESYNDLAVTESTYRRYDSSYGKDEAETGYEKITFYGQTGMIEIKPSLYVKQGESFMIPKDGTRRLGATDITFKTPGYPKEALWHQLEEYAGVGLRSFSHQAYFADKPGQTVHATGVTST